jgi:phosphoribosyl 1,2-cyclic phosphodiesterase
MSLYICSLNSGSNGNCYYIGNETEAVLVDVGISCREVEKRMKRVRLSITKVKAIFISHEHGDHIKGLQVFANKFKIPVFISSETLCALNCSLESNQLFHFRAFERVRIGSGLEIIPFPKKHDAVDPCSFTITYKQVTVGVFTDIGSPCTHLVNHFKKCHAAFLEANYDDQMLDKGNYPYHLKRRIRGGHGHLSNEQALQLFRNEKASHLTHLILSHLSKNNNSPEIVQQLFETYADGVKMIIASRYEETEVYRIDQLQRIQSAITQTANQQLQMF